MNSSFSSMFQEETTPCEFTLKLYSVYIYKHSIFFVIVFCDFEFDLEASSEQGFDFDLEAISGQDFESHYSIDFLYPHMWSNSDQEPDWLNFDNILCSTIQEHPISYLSWDSNISDSSSSDEEVLYDGYTYEQIKNATN